MAGQLGTRDAGDGAMRLIASLPHCFIAAVLVFGAACQRKEPPKRYPLQGQILAVNTLLQKLKQDFPDKFRKEEPTNSEDEEDE